MNTPVIAQMAVIANEVTQSMHPEVMDRHATLAMTMSLFKVRVRHRAGYGGLAMTARAAVHTLGGYSAHADQKDLLNFVARMRRKPRQLRLVHGDADAKEVLRGVLCALYPATQVLVA